MNLDFKEIGKANFQCIQMPDGSVYYGEVEYCHKETGEIAYNYDELNEKQRGEHKLLRHGYGIQLFGRTPAGGLVKYSG